MEKLLTVSIAAYNMEQYLPQCLGSLIIPEIMDKLEVFIVDDGSVDATFDIARRYAELYPNTFIAVHKENGGYGTTVNYSIAHATGKYFKLLDADDWYDREGLLTLMRCLMTTDSDIVATNIYKGTDSKPMDPSVLKNVPAGVSKIEEIARECSLFNMWHLCYRTDILRSSKLALPSHTCYTDQIYSTIPFSSAKTVEYINCYVYCYRLGRNGQSVGRESRIKYTKDALEVCLYMCSFYNLIKPQNNASSLYILRRVAGYYLAAIKTLCLPKPNQNTLGELKKFDRMVKERDLDVFKFAIHMHSKIGFFVFILRITNYRAYWLLKFLPNGVPNWS